MVMGGWRPLYDAELITPSLEGEEVVASVVGVPEVVVDRLKVHRLACQCFAHPHLVAHETDMSARLNLSNKPVVRVLGWSEGPREGAP